ncbi:unnamed protein product [Phyllotreta striolata]|uniref:Protein sleepless n=1 Tax=Phyllotreta striolata TaxID=444603 RepID=A0A9N9TTX3_PHYSR|nr:unnamed protein product [Phyllotreta striolata]
MNNYYCKFIFYTIFLYNFVSPSPSVSLGVTSCFSCKDNCNDPFDTSDASIQNCETGIYQKGSNKTNHNFLLDKAFLVMGNKSSGYVCGKFIMEFNTSGIITTQRRCMDKNYFSKTPCGIVEIVASSSHMKLLSCSICDSELCNSAIGWNSLTSWVILAQATVVLFL